MARFLHFHALSFELNLFFDRTFPLITIFLRNILSACSFNTQYDTKYLEHHLAERFSKRCFPEFEEKWQNIQPSIVIE